MLTNAATCIIVTRKEGVGMITSYSRELMLGIPQGTLIDLETTGLDVEHDEIVLCGYIQGNRLEIICRNSEKEEPFTVQLAELVSTLPRPFYAYNLSFEKGFLQAKGIDIEGVDLFQPWKEKAEALYLKWPKLDELFSHAEQYFNEKFLHTRDDNYLQQIIRHNESDLLRELYLLVYYRDSYKV
jgi:uncharacterized protein YprB with RNaseH-like and TPR domain